jgi:hypothetical protein
MVFRVYPDPLGLIVKPSDPTLKQLVIVHPDDIKTGTQLGNLICPALQVYPFDYGDTVEIFERADSTEPAGRIVITPTGLASRHVSN